MGRALLIQCSHRFSRHKDSTAHDHKANFQNTPVPLPVVSFSLLLSQTCHLTFCHVAPRPAPQRPRPHRHWPRLRPSALLQYGYEHWPPSLHRLPCRSNRWDFVTTCMSRTGGEEGRGEERAEGWRVEFWKQLSVRKDREGKRQALVSNKINRSVLIWG